MVIVKLLNVIEAALKFICIVIMAGIVLMLFYAVVMRYVFKMPPAWSMELSRYSFLWMIMFCAVLVTREQSHIRMDFVVNLIPPLPRFIWMTIMRLAMIGFCYVMVRYGVSIYPIVAEANSPTLGISMGYMYLSIPVGGFLMAVYFLEIIVRSVVINEWSYETGANK